MTATEHADRHPPEPELQFDIGSTDDSLERMEELFARFGDIYRVYAPGRKSYTYVINHPDDVKRVLVSNHRNYTKGVGLDRVNVTDDMSELTLEIVLRSIFGPDLDRLASQAGGNPFDVVTQDKARNLQFAY